MLQTVSRGHCIAVLDTERESTKHSRIPS